MVSPMLVFPSCYGPTIQKNSRREPQLGYHLSALVTASSIAYTRPHTARLAAKSRVRFDTGRWVYFGLMRGNRENEVTRRAREKGEINSSGCKA